MVTIEQLERKILELQNELNVRTEEIDRLAKKSELALDQSMHAYKLDEYGHLWVYNPETKTYHWTKMRVMSPEIVSRAIKARNLAEGIIEGRHIADGAITSDKLSKEVIEMHHINLEIPDGGVTTIKIADGAVTEEKLSEEVRKRLDAIASVVSLGFYSDDDPPTPIVFLPVRPANINKTIVPYLLIQQVDASDLVTEWVWTRSSGDPAQDSLWNNTAKARNRRLTLTNDDFPSGWDVSGVSLSFKCTVTFQFEGVPGVLVNVINVI